MLLQEFGMCTLNLFETESLSSSGCVLHSFNQIAFSRDLVTDKSSCRVLHSYVHKSIASFLCTIGTQAMWEERDSLGTRLAPD